MLRLTQAAKEVSSIGVSVSYLLNKDSGHLSIHCRHTSRPQRHSHAHTLHTSLLSRHHAAPQTHGAVHIGGADALWLCTLCAYVAISDRCTVGGGSPVLKMMVATIIGRKPSMRLTSSTCVTVYSHFSPRPGCFAPLLVAALSRHLQRAQKASGAERAFQQILFEVCTPCCLSRPDPILVLIAQHDAALSRNHTLRMCPFRHARPGDDHRQAVQPCCLQSS